MNKKIISLLAIATIGSTSLYSYNADLKKSESPYLQTYINSSIKWNEYKEEVFERAKKEDKLIFLSIGNNSCKWCDVQDSTVFNQEEVADLLNIYYIAIKLDSDNKPNISKKYSDIFEISTTSHRSVPLIVIMSPDKEIIYMRNFISLYGHDGMLSILPKISRKMDFIDFRKKVKENNIKINKMLNKKLNKNEKKISSVRLVHSYIDYVKKHFDSELGGFKNTNGKKYLYYPILSNLYFINQFLNKEKIRWIYNFSIDNIISKGLRDQVEGGFFSYTEDRFWSKPVFQKTLSTNSKAISLISLINQEAKDIEYDTAIKDTVSFIEKNLKDNKTGFYYTKMMDKVKLVQKEDEEEEAFEKRKEEEISGKYYLFHKQLVSEKANYGEDYILFQRILTQTEKTRFMKIRKKKKKPEIDTRIFFSENCMYARSLIESNSFKENGYKLMSKLKVFFNKNDGKITHLINYKKKTNELNIKDYVYYAQMLLVAHKDTFDNKYLIDLENVLKTIENNFFIEEQWYMSNTKKSIKADLKSDYRSNSILSILFSIYNELYYLTGEEEYKKKKDYIVEGYYLDIIYNPVKYPLVIRTLDKDNNIKYILSSNNKNIKELYKKYRDKYYYIVNNKEKDITMMKKGKSKLIKFKAETIKDFARKEKKFMGKIKDDKFILFID